MKNLKTLLFSAIILVAFGSTATAQKTTTLVPDNSFSVKFIQAEDAYLYFQVDFKPTSGNKKIMTISDAVEGELYVDFVDTKTNMQIFKIEKKEGQVLIFALETDRKVMEKRFTYNQRIIEKASFTENEIVKY